MTLEQQLAELAARNEILVAAIKYALPRQMLPGSAVSVRLRAALVAAGADTAETANQNGARQ